MRSLIDQLPIRGVEQYCGCPRLSRYETVPVAVHRRLRSLHRQIVRRCAWHLARQSNSPHVGAMLGRAQYDWKWIMFQMEPKSRGSTIASRWSVA